MRGYIYRRKNDLFFNCHNCGASHTLGTLLKLTDKSLYNAYQLECYSDGNAPKVKRPDFSSMMEKPVFNNNKKQEIDLPCVADLSDEHIATVYVKSRKIPKKYYTQLYYADDFRQFVLNTIPDFDKTLYVEPRLVIPFYDENNNLLGFTGRDLLNKSKIRYITIKLSDTNRKIYGLDKVDKNKRIYVTEGPIDSMFLNNALATMDAALYNIISAVGCDNDYVFVYDNEPRNEFIVKHMQKTIDMGKNICIWPSHIQEKDINDMVVRANLSSSAIQDIIDNNTFSGLQATLEFGRWKKM
jgi:hypothetical protein